MWTLVCTEQLCVCHKYVLVSGKQYMPAIMPDIPIIKDVAELPPQIGFDVIILQMPRRRFIFK